MVAALRLAQLTVELVQALPLSPQTRLVIAAQIPKQQSLQESVLRSHLEAFGIVRKQSELRLHCRQRAPGLLLLRRAERDGVLGALDRAEARLEVHALGEHLLEIYAPELLVDVGEALLVSPLLRVEDVVESAQALFPTLEIAIHVEQVAIVLQALLKAVRRHELVEVAALDGVGDLVEMPIPTRRALGAARALAEQLRDELAGSDGID